MQSLLACVLSSRERTGIRRDIQKRHERQGRALAALGPSDYLIDLLLYTPDEAALAAAIPGSAVFWAEREGREA